jgi:hypothetical protein
VPNDSAAGDPASVGDHIRLGHVSNGLILIFMPYLKPSIKPNSMTSCTIPMEKRLYSPSGPGLAPAEQMKLGRSGVNGHRISKTFRQEQCVQLRPDVTDRETATAELAA